jgi:hypothetical protein
MLEVPVEGPRTTLTEQEQQTVRMQHCPIAVWFDLASANLLYPNISLFPFPGCSWLRAKRKLSGLRPLVDGK